MIKLNVAMTLTQEMLGTNPADPDIHAKFIAGRRPDGPDEAETLALPETLEDDLAQNMTVFARDPDGQPMLWDYQIKGMIKDSILALQETDESTLSTKEKQKKLGLTRYTYKRTVDNLIFPTPRRIPVIMPEGAEIGYCSRPLRASTLKGERVALATSETVPEGSRIEFQIKLLNKALVPVIKEVLEYGALKGLGQWRNSGKGRYEAVVTEAE